MTITIALLTVTAAVCASIAVTWLMDRQTLADLRDLRHEANAQAVAINRLTERFDALDDDQTVLVQALASLDDRVTLVHADVAVVAQLGARLTKATGELTAR